MVICHNRLQDEIFDIHHRAHLTVSLERGHGLTRNLAHTRPADIPIDRGKPAALDLTITYFTTLRIEHGIGILHISKVIRSIHSKSPLEDLDGVLAVGQEMGLPKTKGACAEDVDRSLALSAAELLLRS